ncbi:MAG: choice-of-anchor D domain-containing protein [Acidobacteria bacterium]|nr:choice-of-anchor D domain-containing protein [Acidobacteriota bacterium]
MSYEGESTSCRAAPGEREAFVTNPNGDSGGLRPFNVFTVTGAFAAIEADASRLDFAGVPTGQSKDLALSVRNTGQATLTINPLAIANPRFSVMAPALPVTIAAGTQQSLIIRFSPVDAGAQSGEMTITSNATNRPNFDIALTGTGVGAPDIVITPGTLDFGTVPVGQTVSRSLSIGNPGNAVLRLYAVTSSNPNFSVTLPPAPLIIPAGGVTSMAAIFTPTSTGAQTGTLLIASSAVNKNTVAIQVRGDTPGGQTLATDDGTVETGALLDGLIIVNRLTPPRYPVTLRSLCIFFAQFQGLPSPVGGQIKLIAFVDPTGSGQPPANPQLIVNQTVTIPAFPANGGFVDFPVTTALSAFASAEEAASSLAIESGDLYIGFQAPRPTEGVVFAADSNGPQQQRAFYSTNDGTSYLRLGGIQNQTGSLTPVNIMMQGIIGGAGLCTYAISPGSQVFTDTGGSGTVTVTAPSGCNWAANSSSNWITFNANSTGTGNGTAGFTVGAGTMPRQAAVTIAGLPFANRAGREGSERLQRKLSTTGSGRRCDCRRIRNLAGNKESSAERPLPTTIAGTTVKVRDSSGTNCSPHCFRLTKPDQFRDADRAPPRHSDRDCHQRRIGFGGRRSERCGCAGDIHRQRQRPGSGSRPGASIESQRGPDLRIDLSIRHVAQSVRRRADRLRPGSGNCRRPTDFDSFRHRLALSQRHRCRHLHDWWRQYGNSIRRPPGRICRARSDKPGFAALSGGSRRNRSGVDGRW